MFKAQHHLADWTGVGIFMSMDQLSLPFTRYTFHDSVIHPSRVQSLRFTSTHSSHLKLITVRVDRPLRLILDYMNG